MEEQAQDTVAEAAKAEEGEIRELAEAVLPQEDVAKAQQLEAWTRSVADRVLDRGGAAAGAAVDGKDETTDPLSTEESVARHGDALAVREATAEVLVFMSLAVPEASWAQWAAEAARAGAPLVMRGISGLGLRATVAEIGRRLSGHDAGVAIDPRLFTLFRVERVPAVVVVPGGAPACESRGCADDAPPPFDTVGGNIGLASALEAIASEGETARETARRHLQRIARRP